MRQKENTVTYRHIAPYDLKSLTDMPSEFSCVYFLYCSHSLPVIPHPPIQQDRKYWKKYCFYIEHV